MTTDYERGYAAVLAERPCCRYFGSDGTLCATHNGRFASPTTMRCDRSEPSPLSEWDQGYVAAIRDHGPEAWKAEADRMPLDAPAPSEPDLRAALLRIEAWSRSPKGLTRPGIARTIGLIHDEAARVLALLDAPAPSEPDPEAVRALNIAVERGDRRAFEAAWAALAAPAPSEPLCGVVVQPFRANCVLPLGHDGNHKPVRPSEGLDEETLALALAGANHGTEYRDRVGQLVPWRYLGEQERERLRGDARRILAEVARLRGEQR